jgi:hypothetical protein
MTLAFPSREEWYNAACAGFQSNGATLSPDTILGISIANGNLSYPPLPADLHDYRYFTGGTEEDRCLADDEFLQGLYTRVNHLSFVKRMVARRRCRAYHRAVSEFGHRFWNYREA